MLFFITLLTLALGHGRLVSPIPRFGTTSNYGLDTAPAGNQDSDAWVCRHTRAENTQPILELNAGDSLNLQWNFMAAHVGDCAVYISYEVDADRQTQKWFKIANLFKCREHNNQAVPITLPNWLPAGDITIRWDWVALHQWSSVEFYSQCVDARITASANVVPLTDIFTYAIPGVYPANGNDGVGYRNPFSSGTQYQTGPPCALNWGGNNCDRTACGTQGFIDVRNAYTGRRNLEATTTSGSNGNITTTGGPTPTSSVAAGCEAYAYSFDDGTTTTALNETTTTQMDETTTEMETTTAPSASPSASMPSISPISSSPSASPSAPPSKSPTTSFPSKAPSFSPSGSPSMCPSSSPSASPSASPSKSPSTSFPSKAPSLSPSSSPSSSFPSRYPTESLDMEDGSAHVATFTALLCVMFVLI